MRCVQICEKVQGLGIWTVEGTGSRVTINVSGRKTIEEADCSLCGQCITHCPVGGLREQVSQLLAWYQGELAAQEQLRVNKASRTMERFLDQAEAYVGSDFLSDFRFDPGEEELP